MESNKYRLMVYLVGCVACLAVSLYLLRVDLIWSKDGWNLFVGQEDSRTGWSLSILTSGFEIVPVVLLTLAKPQIGDKEKWLLWALVVIFYFIDIITNWFALAPNTGYETVRISQTLADFVKIVVSTGIAFMEQAIVWSVQATGVVWKQLQGGSASRSSVPARV